MNLTIFYITPTKNLNLVQFLKKILYIIFMLEMSNNLHLIVLEVFLILVKYFQ